MSQQKPTSLPPYYAAKNLSRQLQIIKRASGVGSALSITENPNNLTLESWLKRHEVYSTSIPPVDSRLADFNVIEVQSQFLDCATVIYTLQVGFPAHPDYPRLSEDPQVQNTLDMVSRFCPSNTYLILHPNQKPSTASLSVVAIRFESNHIFQSCRQPDGTLSVSKFCGWRF